MTRDNQLGPSSAGGDLVVEIAAGKLLLQLTRQDIPLHDALDFATRRNPKRPFLFVSKLLGRHVPTRPKALRGVAEKLSRKLASVPMEGPVLFVGMAETATALGQAVFQSWIAAGNEGLYLDTTRRRTGGEVAFTFREAHSHAVEHFVHLPAAADDPSQIFRRARTIVMVDDETTTGQTAVQLLSEYSRFVGHNVKGCLAVIASWLGGAPVGDDVRIVSLIEGRATFERMSMPGSHELPGPLVNGGVASCPLAPRGSRHGLRASQTLKEEPRWLGQRILVVGVGEFLYLPLTFAEALENKGAEVWVQATTRSPIKEGGAIKHVREFAALTGEGYREYLYNVAPAHPYDRVVICGETPFDIPPGHALRDITCLEQCLLETHEP